MDERLSGPAPRRSALLERPEWRRPGLAVFAYVVLSFLPFAVTLGLLVLIAAASGDAFDLGRVLLALFVMRQINVFVVSTLYHRGVTHRSFRFHPALEWPLRVWGWLFLGAGTRTWALVHRHHHAHADTPEDCHSPSIPGESFWTIGRQSKAAFLRASKDLSHLARYDRNLPDDRLERLIRWDEQHLYGVLGIRIPLVIAALTGVYLLAGHGPLVALLAALATLPGINGSTLAATMLLVNGAAHLWGYRNYDTADTSTNLVPVDLLGWGEAMHHNHHARPGCADMAARRWEWDPAFSVLKGLSKVGLVYNLKGR